ncbi:MAG: response regulator [Flavobacteriales bacterium]|jgi:chemotaxis family two-component system response regulator Rcp1|tara:strand:- start:32 stop:424 length:393 start_codon:yes stop_codon:yes gene_type:complete
MKRILYIEDNTSDVALFEEAIKDNGIEVELQVITDAEEFLDLINAADASVKLPDLIISDVSLPKINGAELILHVTQNEYYTSVPVVAYSTSSYQKDIDACMANGAKQYYQKPMNYYDTQKLIKDIYDKWL